MPTLTISHRRRFYEPALPHLIYIDGLLAGVLPRGEMRLDVPTGSYSLRVQFGGPMRLPLLKKPVDLSLSSTKRIEVRTDTRVEFHDRERLWNLIFDVDLICWIVSRFVPLPTIYKVLSDAFFAIWLLRLVIIRKRYYALSVHPSASV